jgi:hypothetical protein
MLDSELFPEEAPPWLLEPPGLVEPPWLPLVEEGLVLLQLDPLEELFIWLLRLELEPVSYWSLPVPVPP